MSSSKNFKYIDDLIHSGANEIVLDSNIVLADGEGSEYKDGIKLDVDDLTIDGNGHSIDANGKARIFCCTGKNITIKNITLKNGYAKKDGGGAIYNSNELTVHESKFNNNMSKSTGGAIKNIGDLIIEKSIFKENLADYGGGSIYNLNAMLSVITSTFSKNTTKSSGGAIDNTGDLNIVCSTFIENSAKNDGGAVCNDGELNFRISQINKDIESGKYSASEEYLSQLEILNIKMEKGFKCGMLNITESTFAKNNAKNDGGAISNNDGELIINGSTLNNNISQHNGGAVNNFSGNFTSDNCDFKDNSSKGNGGTLNNDQSSTIFNNCRFINNSSIEDGGVIFNHGIQYDASEPYRHKSKSSIICDNCEFYNNSSNSFGGVIWSNFYSKFFNCEFYDNISKKNGNIIYFDGIEDISLIIENSIIKHNSFNNADIYLNSSSYTSIKHTKINNADNYVIYNEKGILDILNLEFDSSEKQSIYNNNILLMSNENYEKFIKIGPKSVIKYKNQKSDSNNGFQYLENQININSECITLDRDIIMDETEQDYYEGGIELKKDNLILNGQNHTIDANNLSRIFIITGNNITLKNIKFKNGFYFKNEFDEFGEGGGAIYSLPDTSVNIENCEFSDNNSRNTAGCVNNKGVMNIYKTTFDNNFAQKSCGAIYNSHELNLDCCDFKSNFAPPNDKDHLQDEIFSHFPFNKIWDTMQNDKDYSQEKIYNETGSNIFNKGTVTFSNCNFNKSKLFYIIVVGHNVVNRIGAIMFLCMAISLWSMFIISFASFLFSSLPILSFLLYVLVIIFILSIVGILFYFLTRVLLSNFVKKQGFDYYKFL